MTNLSINNDADQIRSTMLIKDEKENIYQCACYTDKSKSIRVKTVVFSIEQDRRLDFNCFSNICHRHPMAGCRRLQFMLRIPYRVTQKKNLIVHRYTTMNK